MALDIYTEPSSGTKLSSGDATNPFAITFDGRIGGTKEVRLFVRNDNATVYYTDIELTLSDSDTNDHVDGSTAGFEWKLIAGDAQPTLNDWAHTDAGNEITLPDLGSSGTPNITSYLPFWVQIKVPRNVDIQTITSIKFELTAVENLV